MARIEKERGSDTIVQPRELVAVRYARGVSLSLSARKVFALMMHQAAGDAWRDQEHRIAKRMLRGSHNFEQTFEGGEQGWSIHRFTRRARPAERQRSLCPPASGNMLAFDSK